LPRAGVLLCGADGLNIPCARIQAIAFGGNSVDVTTGGASFPLTLGPALSSSMSRWFSPGAASSRP